MEPARLADERILQIVGEHLTPFGGPWRLEDGGLLKGPGSAGVRVAPAHTDSFRHVDLEFLLNVSRPETAIVDCSTGLAATPEEAIQQAVAGWVQTTASVALEVLQHRGKLATHLQPGDPDGYPGWHAIVGAVHGWAVDPGQAKQQWIASTSPWRRLAPLISTGLDREVFNGVRIFIGGSSTFTSCEVTINGVLHEAASTALAAMDWPRTEKMSTARVFLLLLHPEGWQPGN